MYARLSKIKIFTVFVIILIGCFTLSSKSRNEHDRDLFLSLSSDTYGFEKAKNSSRSFDMLFSAVFLTLDYCDGTQYQIAGEKARTALINGGLTSVPLLNSLTSKGSGGSSHEQYTHMGWNYQYDVLLIQKEWSMRKLLLIDTVEKVFKFSNVETLKQKLDETGSNTLLKKILSTGSNKPNSVAAILYYVHILGDIAENSMTTSFTRIDLQSLKMDLEQHLIIIFGRRLSKLPQLQDALKRNKNTDQAEATILLDLLHKELPQLFSKEKFFKQFEKDLLLLL